MTGSGTFNSSAVALTSLDEFLRSSTLHFVFSKFAAALFPHRQPHALPAAKSAGCIGFAPQSLLTGGQDWRRRNGSTFSEPLQLETSFFRVGHWVEPSNLRFSASGTYNLEA